MQIPSAMMMIALTQESRWRRFPTWHGILGHARGDDESRSLRRAATALLFGKQKDPEVIAALEEL